MISGNVDSAIIVDQSVFYCHSSIVIEGTRYVLVPQVVVKRSMFDLGLYLFYHGHDHGPEMFGFEDYDFIIIIFALFMVCSLTKQVSFLVCHTWFCGEERNDIRLVRLPNMLVIDLASGGFQKYWRFW